MCPLNAQANKQSIVPWYYFISCDLIWSVFATFSLINQLFKHWLEIFHLHTCNLNHTNVDQWTMCYTGHLATIQIKIGNAFENEPKYGSSLFILGHVDQNEIIIFTIQNEQIK